MTNRRTFLGAAAAALGLSRVPGASASAEEPSDDEQTQTPVENLSYGYEPKTNYEAEATLTVFPTKPVSGYDAALNLSGPLFDLEVELTQDGAGELASTLDDARETGSVDEDVLSGYDVLSESAASHLDEDPTVSVEGKVGDQYLVSTKISVETDRATYSVSLDEEETKAVVTELEGTD